MLMNGFGEHIRARSRLYAVSTAMVILGSVLTGGAVWASDHTSIHACVNPAGIPRIVDGRRDCRHNETAISWGTTGPAQRQGTTGPAGPQGTTGPEGPQGPTGPEGPQGPQGPEGPEGPAGADGADGATGLAGPAGADGATGPAGPQGPQGPAGPAGDSGVITFYRIEANATATTSATAQAFCTTGDIVTGGGFSEVETTSHVESSLPLNLSGIPRGWSVTVRNIGGTPDSFTTYAICADITP